MTIIDLTSEYTVDDCSTSSSSPSLRTRSASIECQVGVLLSPSHPVNLTSRSSLCTTVTNSPSPIPPSSGEATFPERKRNKGASKPSGLRVDPVSLLDEDDSDLYGVVRKTYPLLASQRSQSSAVVPEDGCQLVDLADDERLETAKIVEDESRFDSLTHAITVIDLETDESTVSIPTNEVTVKQSLRIGTVNCGIGKAVEFSDGSFMRISSISKTSKTKFALSGQVYLRQNSFGAKVPKRRNEVVWVGEIRREVDGRDLVRNRKLILTNRRYPEVSTRNHPDSWDEPDQDVLLGPLFCRWKRCTGIVGLRLEYECWRNLEEQEADSGYETRISEGAKRFAYRRCTTHRGGSFVDTRSVIDLESGTTSTEAIAQQYTFGDAFCGAGGTSCGAEMAGLKLVWSFDYDPKPVATYRLNFPGAACLQKPVHEFINIAQQDHQAYKVDVLHISPPCQPFSPAHTVPSQQRDETNQAALFSVGELIESIKPRMVTIEETEGLVSRHGEWFAALLHIFIRIGYSVSWKIIKCGDYGIPQPHRRRLMIIAAGPGEILPDFPPTTHAPNPTGQLKKIPTIGDRIRDLEGYPNHDTSSLRKDRQQPFSPDTYAYTLTCNSGVGNYHPSGLRNYTVRELACLQTFPRNFRFADVGVTSQRRQIGNAVPPELAKALMKSIIESLMRSDKLS